MNYAWIPVRDILRFRRTELGLSTADVAKAVGYRSADFVGMLEAGHRAVELERAPLFAQALRLDPVGFCRCVLFEEAPRFYRALLGEQDEPSRPRSIG